MSNNKADATYHPRHSPPHRVERDLTSTDWLVLNPDGDVVYQTPCWSWAIDEAITRHRIDALLSTLAHDTQASDA